jgi:hypothetical protein
MLHPAVDRVRLPCMCCLLYAISKALCLLQLALCGQDPETALNSALASVNFYLQQQQLYFEFREAQLQKKINKVQDACKKKLQEVHTGYTAVSDRTRFSFYADALRLSGESSVNLSGGPVLVEQ